MNPIKNIEIKNFKSIRQLTIPDCRRVNVFIGYPNTGKSNILEALGLFSIDESNLNFASFVRMENLTTLFHNGEIAKQGEVRINDKHRFIVKYQKNSVFLQQQYEKEGTSFEKADEGRIFMDTSADVVPGVTFQIRENDKKLVDFKASSIGKERSLSPVRKYEFLKQVNYSDSGYYSLAYPNGNNIFNIISTNKALRSEVSDLFKVNDLSFSYDKSAQDFKILKFIGDEIFLIPYSLIADTLQRLIFYKAAIISNKETVLIFEEPESHMFPPYISKFTADIIFDKSDNQYFISTHSPFVLNDLMEELKDDQISIYAVGLNKGETTVKRLSDEQISEIYQYGIDLYFNLENYLE